MRRAGDPLDVVEVGRRKQVDVCTARLARDAAVALVVPPAVRDGDRPAHHLIREASGELDGRGPRADADDGTVADSRRGGVIRVNARSVSPVRGHQLG
jgi:hypothetical protein